MYEQFAQVYDGMMHDVDYDGWAAYLDGFLHGAKTVLDCACGTGEISLRLAQRGYQVTGSDRSSDMLAVAREKARLAGRKIPFVRQDMREIALHKPVDAIVCACDGVNYLVGDGDARVFFKSAWAALAPGGLLLFGVSSAYKLRESIGDKPFFEETEDYAYWWSNRFDQKRQLLTMQLTFFVREGETYRRFSERHLQRAYTVEELTEALRAEGFILLGVYEAFARERPAPHSERLQFVCRKEG